MSDDLSARLGCRVICLQGHEEIHAFVENEDNRLVINYILQSDPKIYMNILGPV